MSATGCRGTHPECIEGFRRRRQRAGRHRLSYNCVKFTCAPDLVANLTRVVNGAGRGVFLTPYPRMDAKIALATNGKLDTPDAFDEERINRSLMHPVIADLGRQSNPQRLSPGLTRQ
jgi:hypothetical protein